MRIVSIGDPQFDELGGEPRSRTWSSGSACHKGRHEASDRESEICIQISDTFTRMLDPPREARGRGYAL
jgi:hypothetical protein